ncbi:MAG: glycosyltransferase family 2 protein [Gemmatimonadales bacterium]
MIYVCIPCRDEAETIGLVLWKVRKAFEALGREYHVLVGNDGSTDHSAEVLSTYEQVLPVTILTTSGQGYAATAESLLRKAVELSDRPRRDGAVLMQGDLSHNPDYLGDFVRRLESGADLIVGEGQIDPAWDRGYRWARKWSAWLLRRTAGVDGVKDPTSGFLGFRLATLKLLFQKEGRTLVSDGWAVNAELAGRAAVHARRIETVSFAERHDLKSRPRRIIPWPHARALWGASRTARRAVASEQAAPRGPKRRDSREKGSAA